MPACLVALALAAAPGPAWHAEPYAQFGFDYLRTDHRLVAGLGGGPGVRLRLGDAFAVFAEQRTLWMAGNATTLAVGGRAQLAVGWWRPALGARVVGYFGDQIGIVTGADPSLPGLPGFALQARLAPLSFAQDRFSASALAVDWGGGLEAGGANRAIGVTILDVGVAW